MKRLPKWQMREQTHCRTMEAAAREKRETRLTQLILIAQRPIPTAYPPLVLQPLQMR